jgi:hypothetical protein|tara:strand:+ start:790 stop:924 length:135 start_codon:yes stop_codon:yes gene_type:complete
MGRDDTEIKLYFELFIAIPNRSGQTGNQQYHNSVFIKKITTSFS